MEDNRQTEYIYISELDQAESVNGDDLLIVSQLSSQQGEDAEYASKKLKYSAVRDDIYAQVSATMSSATDLMLSASIAEVSATISSMLSAIDICLSACVALDNCRNLAITNIAWLSSYIDQHVITASNGE